MRYRFDEAQVGALWINNSATASSGITHIYNDSTDNQKLKIGRSNILGNNVAMSIDREGAVSGSFTGSYGGEWRGDLVLGGSTTVSNETLAIESNTGDDQNIVLVWGDSTATGQPYLGLGILDDATASITAGAMDTGDTDLAFYTSDSTEQERMRISAAGNVGIGVEDPQVQLDVAGTRTDGKSLQLRSGDSATSIDSSQVIFSYNGQPYNDAGYAHSIRTRHNGGAEAGNAIDFWVWDQATDTSSTMGTKRVMTLDGNGRVGIGNATPSYSLEVYTNGSKADICIHEDSGGHDSELRLRCGTNDWHIRNRSASDALEFQNESAVRMTLTSGGELYLPDMTSTAGTNYMRYHTTTGRITYSDSKKERKTNIKKLKKSDGIGVISQLRPVTFEMKNERGDIRTGFVVEEVAAVTTSLVSYGLDYEHHKTTGGILTGPDGKKIVKSDKLVPQMWDYEGMMAHLVKAVQQHNTIIEKLKQEIEKMKKN
jgi:hypothetical protein